MISLAVLWGCAGRGQPVDLSGHSLISPRSQENARAVAPSVVGVAAVVDYRLELFQYEQMAGLFVPDAGSPTGYRLAKVANPITISQKIQKVNGAGLILGRDERHAVILTCEHILTSPDTLRTFYRDAAGHETRVLASRAIKRRATYYVIDQSNQWEMAEVLRHDARSDLGLVLADNSPALGAPFPYRIAFKDEVKWGDLAFVFGYPREIKQLTSGLISASPYPGAFALDVVGRFGFSGGPVFVVRPGGDLELAGVIRGVPVNKLLYIAPPLEAPPGQFLTKEDLAGVTAQEYDLIDYGMVYAVGADRIGKFLKDSLPELEKRGIYLPKHLLP
jgi:S1-C subfamily serine protease